MGVVRGIAKLLPAEVIDTKDPNALEKTAEVPVRKLRAHARPHPP